MGMQMVTWPRIDYELLGDPVGIAIRETAGDAWNIETPHFELWKRSYSIITEIHSNPELFRIEIDHLKLVHKLIFPQQSAVKGRINKLMFNTLFKPIEKFCGSLLPSTEDVESGNAADIFLDPATCDAIRLKIYQIVHVMFDDMENLNSLFDLTMYAEESVQKVAVLTVILYVRFYAYRRRIGPQESRRQKLGTLLVPMYWQRLVLGFTVKRESATKPFLEEMDLVDQVVDFAAQMEHQVRQVDHARMVEENARPEVREVGGLAIQAGVAFGLLDEQGHLIDFPGQ